MASLNVIGEEEEEKEKEKEKWLRAWPATTHVDVRASGPGERALLNYVSTVLCTLTMAMPATTALHPHGTSEQLYRFPPFPDPPEGVKIEPFSAFKPAGYRQVTGPSGKLIEVDVWAGIQTVKVLSSEEAKQIRKQQKKRRNAGNAVDQEGRLIPWWEEWEEGEASRAMSESSFDRCDPCLILISAVRNLTLRRIAA